MDEVAEYICPSCGESIQVGVDLTGGKEQHYIEDCPVCCNPNALSIYFDNEGFADVNAQPSQ